MSLHNPGGGVPLTEHVNSLGASIWVSNIRIGSTSSLSPKETRGITRIFEVGSEHGEAIELIPGTVSALSFSVSRYELYLKNVFQAIGYTTDLAGDPVESLSQMKVPFNLQEQVKRPDGTIKMRQYFDCWIADWSKKYTNSGDTVVAEDVSIEATYVRQGAVS